MGESVSTESQPPKLCSWILFPYGPPVKPKSGRIFFGRTLLSWANLREGAFFPNKCKAGQKVHFLPEDIPLISTKVRLCKSDHLSSQMQCGERVGLVAPISASSEGPQRPESQPRNHRESKQYPNENESVY